MHWLSCKIDARGRNLARQSWTSVVALAISARLAFALVRVRQVPAGARRSAVACSAAVGRCRGSVVRTSASVAEGEGSIPSGVASDSSVGQSRRFRFFGCRVRVPIALPCQRKLHTGSRLLPRRTRRPKAAAEDPSARHATMRSAPARIPPRRDAGARAPARRASVRRGRTPAWKAERHGSSASPRHPRGRRPATS